MIWNEVQPAGNNNRNWLCMSFSPTGQIVLAGNESGLYKSNDYGSTWSLIFSTNYVNAVDMSDDGQNIMCSGNDGSHYGGRLYVSTNGGSSWTEKTPAGNAVRSWFNLSVSSDGTKMLATMNFVSNYSYTGHIWYSTNSGSTFSMLQPGAFDSSCYSTMSKDGSTIYIGLISNRMYKTTNGGSSWTQLYPRGVEDINYWSMQTSSNGQIVFVSSERISFPRNLQENISYNGGSSWSSGTVPARNKSVSTDGQKSTLLSLETIELLYTASTPTTIVQETPGGNAENFWAVAVSGNGQFFGAGRGGGIGSGRLYISGTPPPVDEGNDVMMHHMQILGGLM